MGKIQFKLTIKKELLRPKSRAPIMPSKKMKDKTKYTRKDKHKK